MRDKTPPDGAEALPPVVCPDDRSPSPAAWDALIERAERQRATAFDALSLATDRELRALGRLRQLVRLRLWRCRRITDQGLQHLAGLKELTHLDLGLCSGVTDDGLRVLRELPKLTRLDIEFVPVTDRGIEHLSSHSALRRVGMLGTNTGDGAVHALCGNPDLDHLVLGNAITDEGVKQLHGYPSLKHWNGMQPQVDILTDRTRVPTIMFNLRSKIGDRGLARLEGLDGLGYVKLIGDPVAGPFDSRGNPISPTGLRSLVGLPHLSCLGGAAKIGTDDGLAEMGQHPRLHYLSVQTAAATDAGFAALARSTSLQHLFAPGCPNVTGRTLEALASCPTLQALAVGGPRLVGADFEALTRFHDLRHLLPVAAGEAAFAIIGRIKSLETLDCMFTRVVTDRCVAQLVGLPRLRRFAVWCRELGDAGLASLARIESLEELQFEGCPNITERGVEALAELPRLRRVKLAECPQVRREATKHFPAGVQVDWRP